MNPKAYELISGFSANMAAAADRLNKLAKHFPRDAPRLERDALQIRAQSAGTLKPLLTHAAAAGEEEISLPRPPAAERTSSEARRGSRQEPTIDAPAGHEHPTASNSGDPVMPAPRDTSIPLDSFYDALSQFSAGARQMRLALRAFTSFEPFKDAGTNPFDEYLTDLELFRTHVAEAKSMIEAWRQEYNVSRPHRALADRTPAEFASHIALKRDMAETKTGRELTL